MGWKQQKTRYKNLTQCCGSCKHFIFDYEKKKYFCEAYKKHIRLLMYPRSQCEKYEERY